MSLNQVVRSVLSASVLLFGLTSCSSDEAEVRRDEWEEPELVVLRNEDGGARTEISIKDRLDIGDSLTFRFSEPETLSSIRRLDVRALCTGLEETDDEGQWVTYTQENRQEFRLADLMPEALLGSLESEFICQLTVKITNAIGSTKTFDIPRVLAGREREDKLQIEFGFDRRLTPATLEPAQFKDIWVSGPQMRAGTASAHCTRLTQSLQVNDLSQIRLSDLLLQTVKEEKNSIDPRKQYPVQRCKIVFRDSTPIKATAVSRDFVVDFGPVKLFAQARAIADFPHSFLSGEASPVARVFVDNPHPFPVTMKVPVEAALGVAEAVYRTNFPLVQGSIGLGTAPGRFVFSTGPAQEDRLVTIKPRSSVPLLIYFEFTNEPCRHVSALLPPMPQLSTPTALEYELAGVLISNTRKIEISFFTSPEPEEDIGKFRKHGQVNFTLEPFQSYQRWDLQTPQPREIHRPTTFGHKCL